VLFHQDKYPMPLAHLKTQFQARVRQLKRETYALYLAYQHPRTPWYARWWALLVVAYAISPIDLIPDFIPVLGYLDDLILIPAGVIVALRLIPPDVLAECRAQSEAWIDDPRLARMATGVIIGVWVLAGIVVAIAIF
jgi:uncharacterized membrane protein YkvA (DUF1232 family)